MLRGFVWSYLPVMLLPSLFLQLYFLASRPFLGAQAEKGGQERLGHDVPFLVLELLDDSSEF